METTEQTTEGKTQLQKIIFGLKIAGVLCLAPILFALFILDRVILVFLPHLKQESVQETFKQLQNFVPILYRTGVVGLIILFSFLFDYLF
jgi:hypothetical protein